jgi:hypothetical protein
MAGGSAGPNSTSWQSISIFSIKFKFSFLKFDLMGRTDCGPTLRRLHPSDTHSASRTRATGFGFAIDRQAQGGWRADD